MMRQGLSIGGYLDNVSETSSEAMACTGAGRAHLG